MSQEDFAAALECSDRTIRRWENEQGAPSTFERARVERAIETMKTEAKKRHGDTGTSRPASGANVRDDSLGLGEAATTAANMKGTKGATSEKRPRSGHSSAPPYKLACKECGAECAGADIAEAYDALAKHNKQEHGVEPQALGHAAEHSDTKRPEETTSTATRETTHSAKTTRRRHQDGSAKLAESPPILDNALSVKTKDEVISVNVKRLHVERSTGACAHVHMY